MDPRNQTRRIERFLIFRLAVIPLAFILTAICRASLAQPLQGPSFQFLYGLLGSYTVLALVALAALSRVKNVHRFVTTQVAIDLVVAALIIWPTGGVGSVFCPLLFATLFNASTVLRGGGVLVYASLSTAFLALTTLLYQVGHRPSIVPLSQFQGLDPAGEASHLVAMGMALHAVALLGTRLSRGLQSVNTVKEKIIENIAEGLVAVDEKKCILELNGEARRIFGLSGDLEWAGRPLDQVLSGERLTAVREAFRGGERKRFEFSIERPDGSVVPVEAKISLARDELGKTCCCIGLFGDLSLKKDMSSAERRIHKLEELYDMAMGIAHEIRNPLASINGCAQEIGRFTKDNPQELKLVNIICRESGRLDRIIEEFMSSARRGATELVPVDLTEILDETVLQLRNHPDAQGRKFVLVPPEQPALISGDSHRLKQVFLNLGMNAIEATDPSSGEIKVSFRSRESIASDRRRAGEREMVPGIEVEFSDNGPGIPADARTRVFTPFFTTKDKGCGLGLAVVHRIVHDHRGLVDVETDPESGTCFRIWFPRPEAVVEKPDQNTAVEMVHA